MAAAWSEAVKKTEEALTRNKVNHDLVAKRLYQALNAKETKCKFDGGQFGINEWVYSKPLVAHDIRLKAAQLAAKLLQMEPPERKEILLNEDTLDAILRSLPPELGAAVRAELIELVSEERN